MIPASPPEEGPLHELVGRLSGKLADGLGGPGLAVFSANTPLVAGDTFTVAVSNSRNGLIQSGFDVLMPMRSNGLILPSAALSPTILDSLVA